MSPGKQLKQGCVHAREDSNVALMCRTRLNGLHNRVTQQVAFVSQKSRNQRACWDGDLKRHFAVEVSVKSNPIQNNRTSNPKAKIKQLHSQGSFGSYSRPFSCTESYSADGVILRCHGLKAVSFHRKEFAFHPREKVSSRPSKVLKNVLTKHQV